MLLLIDQHRSIYLTKLRICNVNLLCPSGAIMRYRTWSSLIQANGLTLFATKPLPEQVLTNCESDPREQTKLNSLAPGKFEWNFRHVIFKQISVTDGWGISCGTVLICAGLHWWSVYIGSDNGLMPSSNKPLPEPMLTQISVTIWCHYATRS